MVPTERARSLVEMIHDVHSNEVAWEIAEQCFLREDRKRELAPVLKVEEPPKFPCPHFSEKDKLNRRDAIAREIWSQLLANQFTIIRMVAEQKEEDAVTLVGDLAKAAVTYADVLIEALDKRE